MRIGESASDPHRNDAWNGKKLVPATGLRDEAAEQFAEFFNGSTGRCLTRTRCSARSSS